MSKLIIPVESHFPAKVSTRSGGVMTKIKEKFKELDILEKAENSPFGQFFKAPPMQSSGVIIHQLLLRKVATKKRDELQFMIGGKILRFGIGEFALITGLKCGPDPNEEKWAEIVKSRRLIEAYMNDKEDVRTGDLELAFMNCTDPRCLEAWSLLPGEQVFDGF